MDFTHWAGKRYNPFNNHLKRKFSCKVYRVSIDAGFTCPNRDGKVATGGCIYCSERGAASIGAERKLSVKEQVMAGMKVMRKKNNAEKFIAYFQSFTNTYAETDRLRRLYDEALNVEGVVGLAVSTRPDALPEDVIDLLAEYNEKTYLWVELGLQSSHDVSLKKINRGHDYATFIDAYESLKDRGIRICLHMILGLPGETKDDMMETAERMAELNPEGVKIHLLHALNGTVLAGMYDSGEWEPLERDEYVDLVCDVLEKLPPHTVIHRLTGDPLRGHLRAPEWCIKKFEVLNRIDWELERRGSFQGKDYNSMTKTRMVS